jgi:hypothetical protein
MPAAARVGARTDSLYVSSMYVLISLGSGLFGHRHGIQAMPTHTSQLEP